MYMYAYSLKLLSAYVYTFTYTKHDSLYFFRKLKLIHSYNIKN